VGMKISHGCVRLYPEDITDFFQHVTTGTTVRIIDQPYVLGWDKNMLFLEVHEPLSLQRKTSQKKLFTKLKLISKRSEIAIDWQKVESVIDKAHGIPTPILKNSLSFSSIVSMASTLTHPDFFYQQPAVGEIKQDDWSITVTTFPDANSAQKVVAMLNHQGPPIPSRKIYENGLYSVMAGPFHSEKEAELVVNEVQREFNFRGIINPPQEKQEAKHGDWLLSWF